MYWGKHVGGSAAEGLSSSLSVPILIIMFIKRRNDMSSYNNNNSSSGIGILGVLQIIFIVLKLVGVIDWSWWQVFIPGIIEIVLLIILFLIIWIDDKE